MKKILRSALLVFIRYIAIFFAGGLISGIFYPVVAVRISNSFLQGAIFKIVLLAIFIVFLYQLFLRFGYLDTSKHCHNTSSAVFTISMLLTVLLPGVIHSFYYDSALYDFTAFNPLAAFSMNSGLYLDTFDRDAKEFILSDAFNPNFNFALMIMGIFLAFAIVIFTAFYAYKKGKVRYLAEHESFQY